MKCNITYYLLKAFKIPVTTGLLITVIFTHLFLLPLAVSAQLIPFANYDYSRNNQAVTINFDNDTYYYSDYYYTYGLEIKYYNRKLNKIPGSVIFPKFSGYEDVTSYVSIAQRLYTPKSITDSLIQFNDRPFAGTLEIDFVKVSNKAILDVDFINTLRIGIIGPSAGGEKLQKLIHDWIDSPDPLGWDYQVTNDIILNYELVARLPVLLTPSFKIAATGEVRAGTLFDDISIGGAIFYSKNLFDQDGAGKSNNRKPLMFSSLNTYTRYVLYNATLQGGVFSKNNPYVLSYEEISKLVFFIDVTIGCAWRNMSLSYTHNFLTKEFEKGTNHNYAGIKLAISF